MFIVMLNVVMLGVVMLNVIMLGVVILNVVAPLPKGANLTKLFLHHWHSAKIS